MIFPYVDIPFTRINLYQKPVDSRWGAKKLTAICRTELKREPEIRELFLFYNSPKDTLKLFWRDRHGTRDISRILRSGGFLLPAPKSGEAFVLRRFYESGSQAGIQPHHAKRLRMQLVALDTAQTIEDMNIPGFRLHTLKGEEKGRWSIWVNGNWRLTFEFRDGHAYVLDYEDYH
jgi:toxin HigB-1